MLAHTKSNDKSQGFLVLIAIVLGLVSVATIFFFMRAEMHSDSAFYLLLAHEQIESGSLFPPGMCYSTELFVVSPNLLMIPFMLILDNWMLVRAIGISLTWAILLFCIYKAFCIKGDRSVRAALICLVLVCAIPYGSVIADMFLFQGAYLSYCIWIMVFIGIGHYICLHQEQFDVGRGRDTRCQLVLLGLGIVAAVVIPNLGAIRNMLLSVIPFFVAVLLSTLEPGNHLEDAFKGRTLRYVALVLIMGCVIAYLSYTKLGTMYWDNSRRVSANPVLQSAGHLVSNTIDYFELLFGLYGQGFEAPLVTFGGVLKLFNYLYATLSIFVFPIYCIGHYTKLKSRFYRFVVLFGVVSNVLLFAIAVPSGIAIGIPYRLIPTYFVNIILAAVAIDSMLDDRSSFEKLVVVSLIGAFAFYSTAFFWRRTAFDLEKGEQREALVAFLEEHDLEFGYASFWNSYVNTCASDGRVWIVATNGGVVPFDTWLTNERWFKPEYHPGRCFILLQDGEKLNDEELWLSRSSERLHYENYTVLVFDQNIYLYP